MILRRLLRVVLTLLVVALAAWLGWRLWHQYLDSPWTRDGVVQARIVDINADVPGRVIAVVVHDNTSVRAGQLLFTIDPERYQMAVQSAKAMLAEAAAHLAKAQEQAARRAQLGSDVVSAEAQQDARIAVQAARARYAAAQAALNLAALNLRRTQVRAPVAGIITNLRLRVGDYASAGAAEMALVEAKSWWVYGYFEQTRLQKVRVGDPVTVTLLGERPALRGVVESIAPAVADRESQTGARLEANVRPTFNWVRLAARIPVRIRLEDIPPHLPIAAGMLCTVVVGTRSAGDRGSTTNGTRSSAARLAPGY